MINFKQVLTQISDKRVVKRPFFITDNKEYSYGHLIERVNKIRALLHSYNVQEGDRILISITEDYDMFCITLALVSHGASAVLIEPEAKKRRASVIISSANIDGWIVDKSKVSEWDLPDTRLNVQLEIATAKKNFLLKKLLVKKEAPKKQTLDTIIDVHEPLEILPSIPMEQAALIIFTSGTTSDPKGVILTHGNVLAHLKSLSNQYELNESSVISNILPFYHADGLIQGPFLTMYNGISLSRPFAFEVQKIEDLLYSIYKFKVTHFFSVPTMLALIDQFGDGLEDSFDTPEFKYVMSVAGYLEEKLWVSFMEKFKVRVVNVYGLTETVAGGFFCGPNDEFWRVGSIGKPVDSEVKIIDENEKVVDVDDIGELVIKGNHVMNSYVIPSVNPDEQGWFNTGDLASQDEDGFYYVKGRIKNVIIKGGINIYPEEITEVLNTNVDVDEAFVFGEEDNTWGEKIIAAVKMNQSAAKDEKMIRAYCSEYLEQDKMPDEVYFLDELPKGMSGKIIGGQVKKIIQNAILEKTKEVILDASVQIRLLNIASECFNFTVTAEHLNSSTQAIQGWNSLEHLQLATQIEKSFNVELSTKDIMNITSLGTAEKIINEKLKKVK
ncbi:MAG: long-chain acyl-CoA synthetase [Cyclobacteriaceae bacterium]|jgi:long-chain acyl-CoA synthetase